MTDDTPSERDATGARTDGPTTLDRRAVLAATAGVAGAAGVAGCLGGGGGSGDDGEEPTSTPTCPDADAVVETPEGTTRCVAAVEGEAPIAEYYGFDTDNRNSSATPDGLEVRDATVTFVYRNASSGDLSLVFVHDHPEGETPGEAAMTLEGVSGYEWLVRDDPLGVNDSYETTEGTLDDAESAVWTWNTPRTDGGAIGPLDEGFDVELTHLAEGTVGDQTQQRSGIDAWEFVDGDDVENTVELATFGEDADDVSVRVFAPGEG